MWKGKAKERENLREIENTLFSIFRIQWGLAEKEWVGMESMKRCMNFWGTNDIKLDVHIKIAEIKLYFQLEKIYV